MRYAGVRFGSTEYIAVPRGEGFQLLAPVDEFPFANPDRADAATLVPAGRVTPAVPVPLDAAVLCVGLNYRRHADESGFKVPDYPDIFMRLRRTLVPSGATVPIPPADEGLDWEGELVAVVGDPTKPRGQRIFAYGCLNDLSARTIQLRTSQWAVGKNAACSAPIATVLVTEDELGDPYALNLTTRVNGETVQAGSTRDIIFNAEDVLDYVLGCMEIRPGDVIALGTPDGVGYFRTPRRWLAPGDVVEVEVAGVGTLTTHIGRAG